MQSGWKVVEFMAWMSRETSVTFEELRAEVLDLGQFAKSIVDGSFFADSQNAEAVARLPPDGVA
jgi:hypothetical protein